MRRVLWFWFIVAVGIGSLILTGCVRSGEWTSRFVMEGDELVSIGRNPYFILEPGYQRVVEGGETKNGQLIEVARNYFAISRRTNDVFYFGEDVDMYKDGKVVSHDGSWLSGVNGAKFGLIMPGQPLVNASYYQEVAPGAAMDRATIISTTETVYTPAGEFTNCLKIKETTPLQIITEYKYYAPDIGMVSDGTMKLVKGGKIDLKARP